MRLFAPLVIFFTSVLYAQNESNTKATQTPDSLIIITYSILESTPEDFFEIKIICKTPLKDIIPSHIEGDVGKWVQGGKTQYLATWDVSEDINELEFAEFIVQILPMNSALRKQAETRYILTTSGIKNTPLGLHLGIHNEWGGQIIARYGNTGSYTTNKLKHEVALYSLTAGLSKRIYETFNTEIHLYIGGGVARWGDYTNNNTTNTAGDSLNGFQSTQTINELSGNDDYGVEINFGMIGRYKKLGYSLGIARNMAEFNNHHNLLLGIGYVF